MKKKSKIMVLAPVCIFAVLMACFVIAGFLESSTNRGGLYSILMLIAIVGTIIFPFLCSVLAVMGMFFAIKAKKSGASV